MQKLHNNRILIIDDNVDIHEDIRKVFDMDKNRILLNAAKLALFDEALQDKPTISQRFIIDSAYQGDEALKLVRESIKSYKPYALAFVDIRMPPGLDGVKAIKKIWDIDPDIQIVICTAYSDYSWDEMCKQLRYSDNFLILKKPFDVIEIRQLAFSLTKKWQLTQQNRTYIENLEYLLKTRSEELKKSEQLLAYQVTHDALTELPNRALLYDRTSQAIITANNSDLCIGCFFIDVNNFQLINDSFGFQIGDLLLKKIANRLLKFVDLSSTTLARWGGDIFVVILAKKADENYFITFANELLKIIKETHEVENKMITISASVGVSISSVHTNDADTLLKNSSSALNVAKKNGHDNHQIFRPEFNKTALDRIQIENMLYHAIEKNEFSLLYSPVIALTTRNILGVEMSLKWIRQANESRLTNSFITIADEIGVLIPINQWIVHRACHQINTWVKMGIRPFQTSIVLNEKYFLSKDFVDSIANTLTESNVNPNLLEIEIPENFVLKADADFLKKMLELKNMGIHFTLRDFGTSFASLSCISKFPFEKIKINKEFIQGLDEKTENSPIVKAIITVAKNLNLEVIAEGVETYGQIQFLRNYANEIVSGYVLLKPLDEERCFQFLSHSLKYP